MSVVYPMLEILQEKKYTGENNDNLHKIKDNYRVRYFTKSERAVFNNLFSQYQIAVGYHEHELQSKLIFEYMVEVLKKEKGLDVDESGMFKIVDGEKEYLGSEWATSVGWDQFSSQIIRKLAREVPVFND